MKDSETIERKVRAVVDPSIVGHPAPPPALKQSTD